MNIVSNIIIRHDTLVDTSFWQSLISGKQLCVVTNVPIAALYLEKFLANFSGYFCSTVILQDGEQHKTVESWLSILNVLINDGHYRTTTLIALGGGVVGDIAGFAASSYQRGVDFIQVPTTLLAQVDASIGGKTGVNYAGVKNLIGAFYQPKIIVIDTAFLSTLPEREFRAGLAEVIKYALIHDKLFFDYLCQNIDNILRRDMSALSYIVDICCRIKNFYVDQDELDIKGKRALLNFGHTFGHALESASHYALLHGEAVAWGMLQACYLSRHLGYISGDDVASVVQLLQSCGLFFSLPEAITANQLLSFMGKDKKNEGGNIKLILLEKLGTAFVSHEVDLALIARHLHMA